MIGDVINDVKLFPTVYRRIYFGKYLMLSNQMLHNKIKWIRMTNLCIGANHVDPETTLFVRDAFKGSAEEKIDSICYDCFFRVKLTLKRQEKNNLKMSSAEVVCWK